MKLHRFACSALAFCLAAAAPLASFGAAAVSDSFTGSPGPVLGQGGGAGFGGSYTGAGNIVAPGLTYPGLQTSGNKFNTTGSNAGAFRDLAAPISTDGGTIYVAFLAANSGGTAPDQGGLAFFSAGQSEEELFLGKTFQANYGFVVLDATGGTSAAAPVSTTPSLLVYRLTFTPAGDKIDFYANPTPGAALPATPTLTSNIPEDAFFDTFTSIYMQSGEGAGNSTPLSFDELRIGSSFADVAPVPEPAALGLVGLAGLLAMRRRRA
jgi:MYXO-CTERM domain-containing protein